VVVVVVVVVVMVHSFVLIQLIITKLGD